MLHAGVRLAVTAASKIEEAIYMAGRVIPSIRWMKYAALRLGAFIMSYFSIVAAMAVGLALTARVLPRRVTCLKDQAGEQVGHRLIMAE